MTDKTLFDSLPDDSDKPHGNRASEPVNSEDSAKPVDVPFVGIPHSGTDTSRAAAREMSPLASTLNLRVFRFIVDRSDDGATDFDIQAGLGLSGDTERPRRWTLQKCGLVKDSGARRDSPSGRAAIVYVATVEGLSLSRSQAS